jgi:hypothetical protein
MRDERSYCQLNKLAGTPLQIALVRLFAIVIAIIPYTLGEITWYWRPVSMQYGPDARMSPTTQDL